MTESDNARTHYFIYYRIRPEADSGRARATVRDMQAALARRTGVAGRLMERIGDDQTWMEIYEAVTDAPAFEAALAVETDAHKLATLIEPGSARHVERFAECA